MLAGLVSGTVAAGAQPQSRGGRAPRPDGAGAMAEQKMVSEKSATFALAEPAEAVERTDRRRSTTSPT